MKNNPFILLLGWCAFLVVLRIFQLQNPGILFMVWNLFLAWVPYYLIQQVPIAKENWKQWAFAVSAFLFLPNAPYMVTDLFHLKRDLGAPLWFDAVLFLSFALTGILYYVFVFEKIILFVKSNYPALSSIFLLKLSLSLLCGYGIYLGRFVRLNSWNFLTQPKLVFREVLYTFTGNETKTMLFVSLIYGVFLFVLYEMYGSLKQYLRQTFTKENIG